ncbi:hypothetical protein [Bizionia paragorgiae]|uniref:Uncharacterized protein n=1 Tax=Bizionia paragorgiae TaxID=283786 RepID=A0A1H3WUM0_BIZPA|nr:hypothetical protein [Bizionia paragorgiae]SDZ90670.1 hypothetical protein SAMN04487990_1045 [Bizionia paragorgiae]
MNTINENALNFMKSELKKAQIEVSENESGRGAVDFNITTNNGNSYQLFFKSIDAVAEKFIKISKQDLGELNENLLISLVLLIESKAKVLYLIPSTVFLNPNSIFKSNDVMLAHLSNWEISVFTNAIPELSKYALENMIDNL